MLVVSYTSVPGTQIMPKRFLLQVLSVLPEDTLWFVGFQLDRLVMIYGIWWRNMLSSLLTPQGGNNPELCYVLSPGVSSMADPWSSLMANTTDPNPLFSHCSHSHDSQGTSGCHFFHTFFNFYPVFFLSAIIVLLGFCQIWYKLESFEEGTATEKMSPSDLSVGKVTVVFSWLMVDMGGPNPPHRCPWVVQESKLSKLWRASQ